MEKKFGKYTYLDLRAGDRDRFFDLERRRDRDRLRERDLRLELERLRDRERDDRR